MKAQLLNRKQLNFEQKMKNSAKARRQVKIHFLSVVSSRRERFVSSSVQIMTLYPLFRVFWLFARIPVGFSINF